MEVFLVLAALVALSAASPSSPPEHVHESTPSIPAPSQSVLFSLLQDLGFSDTCVASALDTCGALPHEGQLMTLLKEARDLLQEERDFLQEVRDSLQKERPLLQDGLTAIKKTEGQPRHCKDLLDAGDEQSGKRVIYPYPGQPDRRVRVYCDQTTDGGGWTVFQRRLNTTVREDFYRTWVEYRLGFGNLEEEFWLGLDALHALTSSEMQELRIDLADWEEGYRYAKYGFFHVDDSGTNYRLSVGRYSGTAGDGLIAESSGKMFTTHDADHDTASHNCAITYRGAWWYGACHDANLNAYQYEGNHPDDRAKGINWKRWRGYFYSLRRTAMMVRPAY